MGNNDKLVSPSESQKNLKLFESSTSSETSYQPTIFSHEGGHPIPTSSKAIESFFTFLQQRCLVLSCQKKWYLTASENVDTDDETFHESLQQKQKDALNELKDVLTEELELISVALPEGSNVSCVVRDQVVEKSFKTSDSSTTKSSSNNNNTTNVFQQHIDPNPCVDVLVEMMLPGLDENEEIRQAFFASLSKKSLKMKVKKWAGDDDDEDNANGDEDNNNNQERLIQNKGTVRLTIKVPLGYPTSENINTIPRCLLSSLPPLLAIQSHRNAQLLSAVYDTCRDLVGSPMVMNICLCVLSELEAWVTSASQQILEGNLSRADSNEDDFLKAAVINDPWLVEMDDDERAQLVSDVHKEVDNEILKISQQQQQKQGNKSKNATAAEGTSPSSPLNSAAAAAAPSIVQNPGEWRFVIGLVGKPSSGKSSTFNSVTDPESEAQAAKVGNFPFTTIEPNVARAWCGVPCPCQMVFGPQECHEFCGASYGHLALGNNNNSTMMRYRRHPIEIRDVAGLVKGAYKGVGKGNKFLNDLCDADVLVHIVDGGGRNSADGVELEKNTNASSNENSNNNEEAEGASAPEYDVEWVRNEIHNWIFDNVEAKWSSIRSKPKKLLTMFTGYHANIRLTEVALERCGVKLNEVEVRIPAWEPRDLHRLVAHFIRLRFPIVLAVNKCDMPGAIARAQKVADMYPSHVVKTMSARVECELLRLRREGKITNYTSGSSTFEENSSATLTEKEKSTQIPALHKFLSKFHSTGVQDVLAAAISLRPPLLCFPVDNELTNIVSHYAHTHEELEKQKANGGVPTDIRAQYQAKQYFKDCLTLRPGTTAEAAFKTAARLGLLEGGTSSSSSTTAAGASSTHSQVNANRYHEYSLVRCDVVELPMKRLWTGMQQTQQQEAATTSTFENSVSQLRVSVCRKEEVLPSVCCVRMIGKKG